MDDGESSEETDIQKISMSDDDDNDSDESMEVDLNSSSRGKTTKKEYKD